MRKFKIPPVYRVVNQKPTLYFFFLINPLYHPSCTYVSIYDNLHEWNKSSLATSLKCMLNIKVGIYMYLLGTNIFAGISRRPDLCIVGCSVYMLYSDKIYQNGNQEKSENVCIQLEEHRNSSHISLKKLFPQDESWIWIGEGRLQPS